MRIAPSLVLLSVVLTTARPAPAAEPDPWKVGTPIVTYWAGPMPMTDAVAKQMADGGWNLAMLGRNWKRADGTPQDYETSDGYGTGFVIYALRSAGVSADDRRIQKGVHWLKINQRASGRWFTRSMDKDSRQFITHSGTAYAILALAASGETAPATPPRPYEGPLVQPKKPAAAKASSVAPFTPDEPFRKEYSLKAAAQYLDRAASAWQKQKNCFACHTDYVYLIARPAIARGLATHKTIRSALEERVDNPRVKNAKLHHERRDRIRPPCACRMRRGRCV